MRLSDITQIKDGVFELEKGHGDQKLDDGDTVLLLLGGTQTAFSSNQFAEGEDVW